MLSPKKTKFRRAFKGRIKGVASKGSLLAFGDFGVKAQAPDRLTARQIESARRAMTRYLKRQGRIWIRIFPALPVSKKPAEIRMGGGKGSPEYWAVRVHPGRILFEIGGVNLELAREAARLASAKLPIATSFVCKKDYYFNDDEGSSAMEYDFVDSSTINSDNSSIISTTVE